MKKRLNKWIVLCVIIIFQVLIMLFWATQKENYHIDELYTFGYAHYYGNSTPAFHYLNKSEEWRENEYVDVGVLKSMLHVSSEDSLLNDSPAEILYELSTGKNLYDGILNILYPYAKSDSDYFWFAFVVNIICHILTCVFLFKLLLSMTENDMHAIIGVALYGFSCIAISFSIFIRFYSFVMLCTVAILYIHYYMLCSSSRIKNILLQCVSMILIYISMKNSELSLAINGVLVLGYNVLLIRKKRFLECAFYLLPVSIGIVYIAIQTPFFAVFTDYNRFLNSSSVIGQMANALASFSIGNMFVFLVMQIGWVIKYVFGSVLTVIPFILISIYGIVLFVQKRKKKEELYLGKSESRQYLILLVIIFAIYCIFAALVGLSIERYYCFNMLIGVLILSIIISFVGNNIRKRIVKPYYIFLAIAVLACVLVTNISNIMLYVYSSEEGAIELISENENLDSIHGVESAWELYECAWRMDENTKIYVYGGDESALNQNIDQNKILVWLYSGADSSNDLLKSLEKMGYHISLLTTTHLSTIYVCEKM